MALRLTKDLRSTGIHGITGQEVDNGTLSAGTQVIEESREPAFPFGETVTFVAVQNGRRWRQKADAAAFDAATR